MRQMTTTKTFKHLRGNDYYGKSYTGRGECPACGGFNHRRELHKDGFATICLDCGDWECHHEKGKNRISHRPDGSWTALRGRPQLTEKIAACSGPSLSNTEPPPEYPSLVGRRGIGAMQTP